MTTPFTYLTIAAVGNCGKTTIARHVLAPVDGAVLSLETHSRTDDESESLDQDSLSARLFAAPPEGQVLDIGVGDTVSALGALRLVARQDAGLPPRIRIVVPLLADAKSVAGLRWLLAQLPEDLRAAVRATWNRVPAGGEDALRASDVFRAARAVVRQSGARLCEPVLRESHLFDPLHPLVRRYGGVAAVAAIPDADIRAAPLADMPALLAGRDAAQAAQADCRAVLAAVSE